jgi:nucleoside-diphosphate-sugar epimerase
MNGQSYTQISNAAWLREAKEIEMRVFVTGATGFIGSAIVNELLGAGHQVLGLARNQASAEALRQKGAEVHLGDLSEPESLSAGAKKCDGVIHTAYNHDFSQFAAAAQMDLRAIETFGSALAGSGGPLVIASAIGALPTGRPVTEDDDPEPNSPVAIRLASEQRTLALASESVRSSVIRLPIMVHDQTKQGLATRMIALARQTGVSAYVNGGLNRWPAVHRLATAQLFRLALEKGAAGSKFHAIAEDGVYLCAIAEAIGRLVHVPVVSKTPEEAASHFGFLAYFVGADYQASATKTKQTVGWKPTGPGVIADIEATR